MSHTISQLLTTNQHTQRRRKCFTIRDMNPCNSSHTVHSQPTIMPHLCHTRPGFESNTSNITQLTPFPLPAAGALPEQPHHAPCLPALTPAQDALCILAVVGKEGGSLLLYGFMRHQLQGSSQKKACRPCCNASHAHTGMQTVAQSKQT